MRLVAIILLTVPLLSGCGGGRPAVAPAEGTIKLNGKPAANLLIQLTPKQNTDGKVLAAHAVSDKSGRFVFQCDDGRPGAPVGTHQVVVIDNNLNTEDEPKGGAVRVVNRIPQIYASAATPLSLTIEVGKKEYEISIPPGK